jgi:hypothetical protein
MTITSELQRVIDTYFVYLRTGKHADLHIDCHPDYDGGGVCDAKVNFHTLQCSFEDETALAEEVVNDD